MNNRVFLLGGAVLLMSVGTSASAAGILSSCSPDHINPATLVHLQMGEINSSNRDGKSQPVATSDLNVMANGGKVLGYTRIGIRYRSCGGSRDLSKERRDDLLRFFFGKHASKILTLKVNVSPLGGINATRVLASIKRDSDKKGENWDTAIVNDEILLPYFRVDRSSTVTLEAALESDRTYDSSIAGSTLDIIQRAAALINPATALITTENKERFNSAAAFVDGAVNGMLAVSIDEKTSSRVPLDSPAQRQELAIITLKLPMANNSFGSLRFPLQDVGQWVIFAERYRPSMMVDMDQARAVVRNETSVASVLNYLVADKKTVRESLGASKALTTARDELVAATVANEITNKARKLCRGIASEVEALGLTPVDVGAVAWAYLEDLSFSTEKFKLAEQGCQGIEFYPMG